MYFNVLLITLCSKIDSIWVCSSGPIMDSPHDLIEFIKKSEHRYSLIFFAQVENPVLIKIMK